MPINQHPTARQRRLGRVLKELRMAAGMTQPNAAEVLHCTEGKISRIENALSGVRELDLVTLLDAYGVEDPAQRSAIDRLRRESRGRGWWTKHSLSPGYADYTALESDASDAYNAETTLVPGLLQTPDYTRAVVRAQIPDAPPDRVEELTAVKQERKKVLERPSPLTLWAVVSESALRHVVGGRSVMHEQFLSLLVGAERRNVNLHVLPEASEAHAALFGPFVILSFPESTETDVVYVDSLKRTLYLEEPGEVREYGSLFRTLMAEALPREASARTIHRLADEMNRRDDGAHRGRFEVGHPVAQVLAQRG